MSSVYILELYGFHRKLHTSLIRIGFSSDFKTHMNVFGIGFLNMKPFKKNLKYQIWQILLFCLSQQNFFVMFRDSERFVWSSPSLHLPIVLISVYSTVYP